MPRVVALAVVSAAFLAAPASSMGAVTFGSSLLGGGVLTNFGSCGGSTPCSYTQVAPLPQADSAPAGLTAPSDGVVTTWRIRSGSSDAPVKLRIMHPTGSGTFTATGSSGTQMTVSGNKSFPTQLTVKAGDQLGIDNANDALIFRPNNQASIYYWNPPIADNTNRMATGQGPNLELQVQADLEPDVDCDGKGDETQDNNLNDGPCKQGGGGGGDTTPPAISGLALSPTTFAVNPKGAAEVQISAKRKRAKRGTKFSYSLSEAASVTFTIERKLDGRRVGGVCRAPTKKNRKSKRCTRFRLAGAFRQQGAKGANTKTFSGKIGKKSLKPGRYRATLIATDAANNVSPPKRVNFRVVKR